MLVIDGVKLVLYHEPHQVWKLHGDDAGGFQENSHSSDKIVNVRNVGQYVIAKKQVGLLAFGHKFTRGVTIEELHERRNALLSGHFSHVSGRLDAKNRNLLLDEILKQIAVIAG